MAETGYINYGSTQSNVPAELKVYYNVTNRTPTSVTIDIDIGVHYPNSWSGNGCWVRVDGENRSCNPNHVYGKYYWYASSQSNSRSGYWKSVTLSAAAASTSVALSVGFSNKAYAAGTFQYNNFTLTIPIGNTNAYWVNPTCTVSPSGIIPENTSSLSVSWSGARDDQGNQIRYKTEIWKNGSFTGSYVGFAGTLGTSGTVNISGDAPGTSYYFRTYCKDAASDDYAFGKQSSTITKNRLNLPNSFTITSPSTITPGGSYSITCTHTSPSNTNGNSSFTYGLSAQFVNSNAAAYTLSVYGVTSARLAESRFSITIWDGNGSAPTGMYIKQSDIKTACASLAASTYTGTLLLHLTCSNAYGSSGTIQATKAINWQYKPAAPSAPVYSDSSYYTLPNVSGPVFIINKRSVTWSWGAVTDPNGTAMTYLVYAKKGNSSWSLVSTTASRSYTTATSTLTQAQTYQIKVVAKTAYGTMSDESLGPQITLHYYNTPVLSASVIERKQNSVIIKATVRTSTSISNPIGAVSLTYSGLASASTTTSAPPYQSTFEDTKTIEELDETSSGNINLSYTDSVMEAIYGDDKASTYVVVTQWSALLTIREKGIGINAVAGDFADILFKGTTAIHGGDTHDLADGSINFSVSTNAENPNINWYQGAYFDADGNLRAAQDIAAYSYRTHLQFYNAGASSSESGLRTRYWYTNTNISKDVILTPNINTYFGAWMTVPVEKTGSSSVKGSLKISSIYTSNLGSSDTAASQTGLYNAYSSLNSSISTVRNKFTSGTWTPSIDGKSGTGYYFKVDKLCHVYGSVTLSAKMVTSKISGLPFTFYKTYDCLNIMFGEVTTATATGNSKIGPYVRNNGQIIFTDPKGEIYTGFNDWTAAGSAVYIWGVYRTT